nr:hypothetical protein [Candidatus Sigynarchaeum springense]
MPTGQQTNDLIHAQVVYYTSYTNSKAVAETIASILKASGKVHPGMEVNGIRAVTPGEVLEEPPHLVVIGGPIQHGTRFAKPLLKWLKSLDKEAEKANWDGAVLVFFTHKFKKMCDEAIGNTKQVLRDLGHLQPLVFKKLLHLHVMDTRGPLESGYREEIESIVAGLLATVEPKVRKQKERVDEALKGMVESMDAKLTDQERQNNAKGIITDTPSKEEKK